MKLSCSIIFLLICTIQVMPIPESYLLRTEQALNLCRNDLPKMEEMSDQAASRLAAGGKLWATGEASFISEFCGRAGGLMLIERLGDKHPKKGDVLLFGLGSEQDIPEPLSQSGALIIGFSTTSLTYSNNFFLNHAETMKISPSLGNIISAWVFTGELIASLTRLHKMPVVFETIGLYGGFARIDQYLKKGILWHDPHQVPPISPGVIGNRYIVTVGAMLRRVEKEHRGHINQAADWAKQAKKDGKQLIMYSMGHYVPIELSMSAIGKIFATFPWNSGFNNQAPEQIYTKGDLIIHVGYQHPPYQVLKFARSAGARVVYIDILQHRDYVNDPNVIWIDPMWSWSDACVELEGCDIPILPASGIVNGTLAWEIYQLMDS